MTEPYMVQVAGTYRVTATAIRDLKVYRDRTRLVPHHPDTEVSWVGRLERGDLVEAMGDGVKLEVVCVHTTAAGAGPADPPAESWDT